MQLLPVIHRGEKVLAAVSGGADSVCLLRLLAKMRDEGHILLAAAHFNHGIRGAAADGDEEFVRALCRSLQVQLFCGREEVPALAEANRLGLETQARICRRRFLMEAMARSGSGVIATAHHMQDQAETVLMHLLRGSALRGAGGIRPREGCFVRPLLNASKEEILSCLESMGQPYRQDDTNLVPDNPRNALRLHVMPLMRNIYPAGERGLARFAGVAAEAADYLSLQAGIWLEKNSRAAPFGSQLFLEDVHPALLRQALAMWSALPDGAAIQQLVDLTGKEKGAMEWAKARVEKTGSFLYRIDLPPKAPPPQVEAVDGAQLPGLGRLSIAPWQAGPIGDDPLVQAVPRRALEGAFLRTRRPGDIIHPLGGQGRRKLSDVFTDKKIPRPWRDHIPLVVRGDKVLWAIGVCLSQDAALKADTQEKIRLEWMREEKKP